MTSHDVKGLHDDVAALDLVLPTRGAAIDAARCWLNIWLSQRQMVLYFIWEHWLAVVNFRAAHTEGLGCYRIHVQVNVCSPSSAVAVSCTCASDAVSKPVALGGALLPAGEPHFAASRVQSVMPGPLWGAFK